MRYKVTLEEGDVVSGLVDINYIKMIQIIIYLHHLETSNTNIYTLHQLFN